MSSESKKPASDSISARKAAATKDRAIQRDQAKERSGQDLQTNPGQATGEASANQADSAELESPPPNSPPPNSQAPLKSTTNPAAAMSSDEASATLEQLDQELNRLQRTIRAAIQNQLAKMSGRSLGTLQHNRDLASSIHQVLESHGLRVQCSECGHPAILRVSPRAGAAHGVFVFDHTIEGRRTFHGGRSTVPPIRLVAKPPRKKARRAG